MIVNEKYLKYCKEISDINEHMPTLYQYALECKHITEMGVRNVVSTWAFLNAKPDTLISYDIHTSSNIKEVYTAAAEINTKFTFIQSDVLKTNIEDTDLLFIDTLHQYNQLTKELNMHANKVRKYIIFHDTSKFEYRDEYTDSLGGLWPAIETFLEKNKNFWKLKERYTNNNGLTVIERINENVSSNL